MKLSAVFVIPVLLSSPVFAAELSTAQFHELMAKRSREAQAALAASPYSALSKDFFSRFSRNPDARPEPGEIEIDGTWMILLPDDAGPIAGRMAEHFVAFMDQRMGVKPEMEKRSRSSLSGDQARAVVFLNSGGGTSGVPESFTISVTETAVRIIGRDAGGLRDGIVKLVDEIGFRHAPILAIGRQTYTPRLAIRHGSHGSLRDTVFMGFNAVAAGGGSLYAFSTSEAIPELKARRVPGAADASLERARQARQYGLKTYFHMSTVEKFPKDDPIFEAHPNIRGALTWKADGDYTLCTEHPLVRRYLTESVEGIFRSDPKLDGLIIIIGGEGFYHCYMRPFGVKKGHTNCKRCEPLGAETVVANLVNSLAAAARQVNPAAEIYAWPYSAEHVWSADRAQAGLIEKLKPGAAIMTEMVKDEIVEKPGGIRKRLWDYSIDLIGPGRRATAQIEACAKAGISIRVLSMAEETFEASLLPNIPCMDRWLDRADAMVTGGHNSAYVFQMGPYNATVSAEAYKLVWWDPVPDREALLQRLAARVTGKKAGPHLRAAWKLVSQAIDYTPVIGSYYKGPHYLGPMHPMFADGQTKAPEVFNGYYLFLAEITARDAVRAHPTYVTSTAQIRSPASPGADAFEKYYRTMEKLLKQAVDEVEKAAPLVEPHCELVFNAEQSSIRWFYHTARTEANFFTSCRLRDRLVPLVDKKPETSEARAAAEGDFRQWRDVLLDERENARAALPVLEADVRLDFYHRGDHSFPHAMEMLRAKLAMIEREITEFLPALARRCGLDPETLW